MLGESISEELQMLSHLNGGNIVKGINTWAVSLLIYATAFIDWTRVELCEMDRD